CSTSRNFGKRRSAGEPITGSRATVVEGSRQSCPHLDRGTGHPTGPARSVLSERIRNRPKRGHTLMKSKAPGSAKILLPIERVDRVVKRRGCTEPGDRIEGDMVVDLMGRLALPDNQIVNSIR